MNLDPLLLTLPIVAPLVTAGVCLLAWRSTATQRVAGVIGMAGLLLAAVWLLAEAMHRGPIATQLGGWRAPIGITFVADALSAVLVLLAAVMGLAASVYSLADVDPPRQRYGYFALVHVMTAGVCGAFLTGDLFNLFVWFEVMLIASFVLLALGNEKPQVEGAVKYVALNLVSSAIFLTGLGLVYATAGTLTMADLHGRLAGIAGRGGGEAALVTAVGLLFLVSFGIKAAAAPLFFWLPASYATPPAAVSALFAGLLTKVGVYSLIRATTLIFPAGEGVMTLVLVVGCVTMVVGVLGAVAQFEFRRILAFHSVSQIGYMITALGLLAYGDAAVSRLALASAVLYMLHHSVVKSNLFLVSGIAHRLGGGYSLATLAGLARSAPWLAGLFLVTALSLAGIPPLSGFWAKLGVVMAGLDAGAWLAVAAALATGLCTLISMIKIWNEAFWKPAEDGEPRRAPAALTRPGRWSLYAPVAGLAAVTVVMGLAVPPVLTWCEAAADHALNPAGYVEAVDLLTAGDVHARAAPATREGVDPP